MRPALALAAVFVAVYSTFWQWPWQAQLIPQPQITLTILEDISLARITYYNAVPEQTDSTPDISACGPNLEAQVAVSRDLFRSELHCGDVGQVWSEEGYIGEFTVWDTMNSRFSQTRDILTEGHYDWGKTAGHLVVTQRRQE